MTRSLTAEAVPVLARSVYVAVPLALRVVAWPIVAGRIVGRLIAEEDPHAA
jgi:hypothetical protein